MPIAVDGLEDLNEKNANAKLCVICLDEIRGTPVELIFAVIQQGALFDGIAVTRSPGAPWKIIKLNRYFHRVAR